MAYLEFVDETQAVLFVEAKLTTYEKASWPEAQRGCKQFNSKINGQLELNHRLGLALQGFHPEVDSSLAEPEWILDTGYKTALPGIPRSVKKPAVPELVAGRLAGLSPDCYYHLAITTDDDAPLVPSSSDSHATAVWARRRGCVGFAPKSILLDQLGATSQSSVGLAIEPVLRQPRFL